MDTSESQLWPAASGILPCDGERKKVGVSLILDDQRHPHLSLPPSSGKKEIFELRLNLVRAILHLTFDSAALHDSEMNLEL
jgi:hypothetical protein